MIVTYRGVLINRVNGRWYYSITRGKRFTGGSAATLDRAKALVAAWLDAA